tara:strand:+ start:565 stop:759 length:195 start_codon:yes stop_codon:yes gene_type:complete
MELVKTNTFTHLSLAEYITREARACKQLDFPYEMYVGYMRQWAACCYDNIIMPHSDYLALEITA